MTYGRRVPRLVVVLPLVPLRVDDGFPLRSWPLHVTVAPTFVTDDDAAAVAMAIAPVVEATPVVPVTAGGVEGFGPSGRIPVTLVVPSPGLTTLHGLLLDALETVGAHFDDPEYTGRNYRAHVTHIDDDRMQPGQVALLRQAALVDMEPVGTRRWRQVVWVSPLQASDRPTPRR